MIRPTQSRPCAGTSARPQREAPDQVRGEAAHGE